MGQACESSGRQSPSLRGGRDVNILYAGYNDQGVFQQSGGSVNIVSKLQLGNNSGSSGTYRLSGTGTLSVTNSSGIQVGTDAGGGIGRFEWFKDGGISADKLELGSNGTLAMGYSFNSIPAMVGGLQLATLEVTNALVVGSMPGTSGTYQIQGGTLEGGAGLSLRPVGGPGAATFTGYGSVALTGTLVNNGRVVADGFGLSRDLDLSQAAGVLNSFENQVGEWRVVTGKRDVANNWIGTNDLSALSPFAVGVVPEPRSLMLLALGTLGLLRRKAPSSLKSSVRRLCGPRRGSARAADCGAP